MASDFDFFSFMWQPRRPVYDGSLVQNGFVIGNIVRWVNGPIPAPQQFIPRLDFSDKRDSQYIGIPGLPP